MNSWDCLAGLLLAEEAGACVGDFLNDGSLGEGGPVIASVPALASQLSDASEMRLRLRPDATFGNAAKLT